jgi:hypothetical protein
MFGRTPAWGLWTRHVRGLTLKDVALTAAAPDTRPQALFEDTTLR